MLSLNFRLMSHVVPDCDSAEIHFVAEIIKANLVKVGTDARTHMFSGSWLHHKEPFIIPSICRFLHQTSK